ncbi:ATP-dependent nuclease subunit B [Streptococcus suis]|uniref:ATP-dependent nuclease subunit B n=1 Tax=Streptococcus suis TaxID=1307 RepID=UPI001BA58237|nr:ATP-dependent nuclease subunit B [Streptococcus suis]MBS0687239.1 ATP-dependent nuclease subunit B [Streptococcus suis]MBS0714049.1 ATP-dependent nuclease subunit B [Streptococcus suis]
MKLVYTDIRNPLTQYLTDTAAEFAKEAKRVFYIAPNSLSFEMERKVLEYLPEQATFDIIVTRFGQLVRYLMIDKKETGQPLDDVGLAMIFFRVLSQFEDGDLKVYGRLQTDFGFINQLVALYKELQRANMSILDLEAMESPDKQADLVKIFLAVTDILSKEGFEHQSKLAQLTSLVETGQLDEQLKNIVLAVDGFSRFSAEEEALVSALNERVSEILIGVYASKKAVQATYAEGNVYQANVDFLRQLSAQFQTKATYIGQEPVLDSIGKFSKNMEAYYDYSGTMIDLTPADQEKIQLWEVVNQKEEVEQVATAIRQHVHQGARYKDILLLLGDVDSYKLQIGKIFDKYDIPYYFGKAEEMSHHPLVHFVESLERLRRYRFRAEDLLNLLKSGLYASISQKEMDLFESYILFADMKGQAAFSRTFSVNGRADYDAEVIKEKRLVYDLAVLEPLRAKIMEPLNQLFKAGPQSGTALLEKFMAFLEAVELPKNMEKMSRNLSEVEQEKEEQVWKSFTHILENVHQIFGKEKLKMDDFLAILQAGMQASHYRTVPATVDVVNVKSYDLIEAHTAKYVYAIGMGQANFPKVAKNTSLLTEEEMEKVNLVSASSSRFDLVSRENIKKNHAAMMSLLNAATEQLVISTPQIYNEGEDSLSPYIKILQKMGLKSEERGRIKTLNPQDIGHYKSLLSRLIESERPSLETEEWEGQRAFWTVLVRHLKKKLESQGIEIPTITGEITSKQLSDETLAALYPEDKSLNLSASSLTNFYNNQYLYFVRNVLRLREQESIHPTAFQHGLFLHRIFERVVMDQSELDFDQKVDKAILRTRDEAEFAMFYNQDADARYTEEVLDKIARSSATILRDNDLVEIDGQEKSFRQDKALVFDLQNGKSVHVNGTIDRLDTLQINQAVGVVDYKSSDQSFSVGDFYNGLKPQLVTYLAALQELDETKDKPVFGAMYLHLQDPIIKLKDTKNLEQLEGAANTSLVYKGLFLKEESLGLNHFYQTRNQLYTKDEFAVLLNHNQELYKQAAKDILDGRFAINPYTKDGRSVAGDQLKAITGFEADRHMGMARRLVKEAKRQDWMERMKGGQD